MDLYKIVHSNWRQHFMIGAAKKHKNVLRHWFLTYFLTTYFCKHFSFNVFVAQRYYIQTDRHHCLKSDNIHKTEGGHILHSSPMTSMKFHWHKKCFLAKVFYREYTFICPNHSFMTYDGHVAITSTTILK